MQDILDILISPAILEQSRPYGCNYDPIPERDNEITL